MRFVSTSIGFEYLQDAQYIDREMEIWLTVNCFATCKATADSTG